MIQVINLTCFLVMFLWAYYHAHVAERVYMRFAYVLMCLISVTFLLFALLPIEENTDFRRAFLTSVYWQPTLPRMSFMIFCVCDLAKEYKTPRFVEAFKNNKVFDFLDYTKT